MPFNLIGQAVSSHGQVLGCSTCPMDKVKGVRKVKGLERIKQRHAMLWAQSPGRNENAQGLELVGASGELLWPTLRYHGLRRTDFDLQNVMRCWPVDEDRNEHAPTKQELLCCSVHNDEALKLNRGEAVVHLILGEVAGKQLLGSAYRKDNPIFWYEPWDAYVVLNAHPAYITRLGGEHAGWPYYEWRERFRAVRMILDYPGQYGYIRSLDYQTVSTAKDRKALREAIQIERTNKRRVSVDIEMGEVNGKTVILCVGFGTGYFDKDEQWIGKTFCVVLDHPEGIPSERLKQLQIIREILEDPSIAKTFQNGAFDVEKIRHWLDFKVRGFDYDTMLGTWLRYSFLRSVSLENLGLMFFPEFGDYKSMMAPYAANYAQAPLAVLALYNCADCDLTKRLEARFAKDVNPALMQVYIGASFTLDEMEKHGPLLDRGKHAQVKAKVPELRDQVARDIERIAEVSHINIGSQQQVAWLLYDHLGLPLPTDKRGNEIRTTVKEALELLAPQHPVVSKILKHRVLEHMIGTYIEGYERSADLHGGELRTIWWLTGAITGRLRSGKGNKAEAQGVINMQNLHGNPLLLNMIVSDLNWSRALSGGPGGTEPLSGAGKPRSGAVIAGKRGSTGGRLDDLLDLYVFLSVDYSQIEVRMLAELSGDPYFIAAFNEGADIHSAEGHLLTGWSVERIKQEKSVRRMVKNMVFGIIFGIDRDNLHPYIVAKIRAIEGEKADLTGITPERVGKLYDKFFAKHPAVRRYIDRQRDQAERLGYVETMFGFRREIRQNDETRGTYWGNQAINSPIQGSAHTFLLINLAQLHRQRQTYNLLRPPAVLMEIHDQLVFRVKLRDLIEAHRQAMLLFQEGAVGYVEAHFNRKLKVPIVAEAQAGFTMGSLVDYTGGELEDFLERWNAKYRDTESKSWEKLLEGVAA